MKKIIFEISSEQKEAFIKKCKEKGETMSDAIRAYIECYVRGSVEIKTKHEIVIGKGQPG